MRLFILALGFLYLASAEYMKTPGYNLESPCPEDTPGYNFESPCPEAEEKNKGKWKSTPGYNFDIECPETCEKTGDKSKIYNNPTCQKTAEKKEEKVENTATYYVVESCLIPRNKAPLPSENPTKAEKAATSTPTEASKTLEINEDDITTIIYFDISDVPDDLFREKETIFHKACGNQQLTILTRHNLHEQDNGQFKNIMNLKVLFSANWDDLIEKTVPEILKNFTHFFVVVTENKWYLVSADQKDLGTKPYSLDEIRELKWITCVEQLNQILMMDRLKLAEGSA